MVKPAPSTTEVDEETVRTYLPLVKHVASKLSYNLPPSVEFADLVSMGMVGLIDACKRFDASRGLKFSTYASFRIRGEILNQLNALSWVPRSVRDKSKRVERTIAALDESLGRPPEREEIAKALELKPEEYDRMLQDIAHTSFLPLEECLEGPRSDEEVHAANSEAGPEDIVELEDMKRALVRELERLPERERMVVSLYYYDDLSLKEIGSVMNFSESRACQLLSQATARLRGALSEGSLRVP